MTDQLIVTVAQPLSAPPLIRSKNLDIAQDIVERAKRYQPDLLVFPENFPGPWAPSDEQFDAVPLMTQLARDHDIAICWGRVEKRGDLYYAVIYVVDRDGSQLIRHERTHPTTMSAQDLACGISPGDEFGLFEFMGVRFGIAVCCELWVPEVTRCLTLNGAEVILSPAGGGFTNIGSNWKIIARARALENACHVILTTNRFNTEAGLGMVAGPESTLAEAGRDDFFTVTIDLRRTRWLRDFDGSVALRKAYDAVPARLRARRPELYGQLTTALPDDFDYSAAGRVQVGKDVMAAR